MLDTLKNNVTVPQEGLVKSHHILNNCLILGGSGTLTSPRPICSPSLTKSYVPADPDITSVPEPALTMSRVLSQTELLLSSRLRDPLLFQFPAPENDLSPYPRLGVVFFSVQNVVPGASSSLTHNRTRGTKRASLGAVTKLVKYQNCARDTEVKNDENVGGSARGWVPPLRTYSMRTIRKKRSISFIF